MVFDASRPTGNGTGAERAAETLKSTPTGRRLTGDQRGKLLAAQLFGTTEQADEAAARLDADRRRKGRK